MGSRGLENLIEKFVNNTKRPILDVVYGERSHIKVTGASFSPYKKHYYLSVTVFLGDIKIDDTILDNRIVSSLIMDFIEIFDPGKDCSISVKIDVP